jgi:hypothetical protein
MFKKSAAPLIPVLTQCYRLVLNTDKAGQVKLCIVHNYVKFLHLTPQVKRWNYQVLLLTCPR